MKLSQIVVKNYRTLADLTINFEGDYCTISGQNNAGKSCVINLIRNLFQGNSRRFWSSSDFEYDYKDDKTQWVLDQPPIEIKYLITLNKLDDPALIFFIEKLNNSQVSGDELHIALETIIKHNDEVTLSVSIEDKKLQDQTAMEIFKKIKSSNLLFLHNSTTSYEEIYFVGRRRSKMFYEITLSDDEQKNLSQASKGIEKQIQKLARERNADLANMLGKLSEKYDVEFATIESLVSKNYPFSINLKDKSVEVPLGDWGSGTQNRTYIFMSILQANRIKKCVDQNERITPIVVIEEPESFLHPSAQAEFGRILRDISAEFGIQIIVTTHSPYMLNQVKPSGNILLKRKVQRNKILETIVVSSKDENWMAPFSEHLGVSGEEFSGWANVFSVRESKVCLVEGEIDKEYFEHLRKNKLGDEVLDSDIEIVPYGGKDALKNTLLVKFVLAKFNIVYVTFDLDASADVTKSLERLELNSEIDFTGVGVAQPGRDCIEGLLPNSVISKVSASEPNLIGSSLFGVGRLKSTIHRL